MAGHRDEQTYDRYYAPNNSGVDGQNLYGEGKLRTVVSDRFRGETITHNPELWQSLPAEKQEQVERSPEFIAIEQQLEDLAADGNLAIGDAKELRKMLSIQKRKLGKDALREFQKKQSNKILL
ncbi:MAG: hypothetical protein LQ340_001961 [Diploschistes diacapsis]|nr:MAG: hypothetical protein LQ340_001961 [Diploschistes diacapsis]